jgi:N-acetylglutamate synthase-like GNAT family acetyltransferase
MIRQCSDKDFAVIWEIINDAAQAYKGVIPEDRWHEPYMTQEQLQREIASGVCFWGFEENGRLTGVMGIQDKDDVTLIRHAYVRTTWRNCGTGSQLLKYLETMTQKQILIGTWANAVWAVTFYEKNGYRRVSPEEKNRLLKKYWNIPDRQIATSVVLARAKLKS